MLMEEPGPAPKKLKSGKIADFFIGLDVNSVDYAVSRTAAKRCISINTIVESEDILIGLNARKLKGDAIEVLSTGPGNVSLSQRPK